MYKKKSGSVSFIAFNKKYSYGLQKKKTASFNIAL